MASSVCRGSERMQGEEGEECGGQCGWHSGERLSRKDVKNRRPSRLSWSG